MALAESIFTKLGATAAITAIIGSGDSLRAYPTIAPQDVDVPYVVFSELPPAPDNTLNEASTSGIRPVQFSCVATSYKQARDLATAILAAFDNATLAGGERCLSAADYDGYSEATDQFLRHVDADFFAAPAT